MVGTQAPVTELENADNMSMTFRSHERDGSFGGSQSYGDSRSHTVVFSPYANTKGRETLSENSGVYILKAPIPSKHSSVRQGRP